MKVMNNWMPKIHGVKERGILMETQGKVWLVGAGPGDLGLLTLKGKAVLDAAQVVVYDALVGPEVLALVPEAAERINVGKRASHHTRTQAEINQILLEKAREGKRVVRLKGGDPFLFGRGGEELELLSDAGIPYEVVPGVTSAIAVPAYNGLPVTHRNECSSVHVITGHKKKDQPLDMDFEALVRLGGTLVFLMGVTALPEICQGLLSAGMPAETPAAVLEKGATAEQRRITAALAELPEEARRQKAQAPAILVVGGVCRYSDRFDWAGRRPLAGCRAIVTRPRESASALARKLREKGAQVLEIPAIATRQLTETEHWNQAMDQLDRYSWLAFTSPAGVRHFFDRLRQERRDVRVLAGKKMAALGSGTARELENRGILVNAVPEVYDGAALGRLLAETCEPGASILLPRAAAGGAEILAEIRSRKDLSVTDLAIYETVYPEPGILQIREELEQHPETLVLFTSASTVRGFSEQAKGLDFRKVRALCIGKQTQAQAEALGMQTEVSRRATMDSLVELAEQVCRRKMAERR